jgi:hypothetical protein
VNEPQRVGLLFVDPSLPLDAFFLYINFMIVLNGEVSVLKLANTMVVVTVVGEVSVLKLANTMVVVTVVVTEVLRRRKNGTLFT